MRKKIVGVWLKRDLRIQDHQPFSSAIETGLPIFAFYLWEPKILRGQDVDPRHLRFISESLQSINRSIEAYRAKIHSFYLDGPDFFRVLFETFDILTVYSHLETGNALTFERDRALKAFFRDAGIAWIESKQSYTIRGLRSGRMGWKEKWEAWAKSDQNDPNWEKAKNLKSFLIEIPELDPFRVKSLGDVYNRSGKVLCSSASYPYSLNAPNSGFQKGGWIEGRQIWESFLSDRYRKYSGCISKPEESRTHCSRISPYLAWGNLSLRSIYQETKKRREELNYFGKKQLDRFLSRLAWRDHMIQKFESECRIEYENFNSGYDLIKRIPNEEWIRAWETGRTGFPLIDASMRCLIATGYLNFRMRALLVSFFTMILWQDWRWASKFLARQFLDYEPGIHYFQLQMQAGTVGNHQIRIYNPYKQIKDNDPDCIFIKKWIPELEKLSTPEILAWGTEEPGLFSPKVDYPSPILDFTQAYKSARDIQFNHQKSLEVKREILRIRNLHVVDRRKQSFR
jgi:deoxyribodipyrimidine photo-lyase